MSAANNPDANNPDARELEKWSAFEQQLSEVPSSTGPSAQRRDRLMYDSGYAAAVAQLEVQLHVQRSQSGRSLLQWKFFSLAMSVMLVAAIGAKYFYGTAGPSSMAVVAESSEKPSVQTSKPSSAQIWPGMAPEVAQATPNLDGAYRVTSVRTPWTDDEPALQPIPDSRNTHPANTIESPLRATDYRSLLDRT